MTLRIQGSTIGYDQVGMNQLINDVYTNCVIPASQSMRTNAQNTRYAIDQVWVGSSAEAFKEKLTNDTETLCKTLEDVAEAIKNDMNNAGSNVEAYDEEIARALFGSSGGGGGTGISPSTSSPNVSGAISTPSGVTDVTNPQTPTTETNPAPDNQGIEGDGNPAASPTTPATTQETTTNDPATNQNQTDTEAEAQAKAEEEARIKAEEEAKAQAEAEAQAKAEEEAKAKAEEEAIIKAEEEAKAKEEEEARIKAEEEAKAQAEAEAQAKAEEERRIAEEQAAAEAEAQAKAEAERLKAEEAAKAEEQRRAEEEAAKQAAAEAQTQIPTDGSIQSSYDGDNKYLDGVEVHSVTGDIGRQKVEYTEADIEYMAQMVENECRSGNGRDGQVAVAEEIRNRCVSKDAYYPDDVTSVLNQGYRPYVQGTLPAASEEVKQLCRNVLEGKEWIFGRDDVLSHASHNGASMSQSQQGVSGSKGYTAFFYPNASKEGRTQTFFTSGELTETSPTSADM